MRGDPRSDATSRHAVPVVCVVAASLQMYL